MSEHISPSARLPLPDPQRLVRQAQKEYRSHFLSASYEAKAYAAPMASILESSKIETQLQKAGIDEYWGMVPGILNIPAHTELTGRLYYRIPGGHPVMTDENGYEDFVSDIGREVSKATDEKYQAVNLNILEHQAASRMRIAANDPRQSARQLQDISNIFVPSLDEIELGIPDRTASKSRLRVLNILALLELGMPGTEVTVWNEIRELLSKDDLAIEIFGRPPLPSLSSMRLALAAINSQKIT